MCVRQCVSLHVCEYVNVYVRVCVCECECTCVCMCVCECGLGFLLVSSNLALSRSHLSLLCLHPPPCIVRISLSICLIRDGCHENSGSFEVD